VGVVKLWVFPVVGGGASPKLRPSSEVRVSEPSLGLLALAAASGAARRADGGSNQDIVDLGDARCNH